MKKEYYHRKNLGSYGVMYGFQFINLIKMKGKVAQGATWWFWARYPFIRYLIHFVSLTPLKQVTTENVSQKTTGSFNLARFSQVGGKLIPLQEVTLIKLLTRMQLWATFL